MHPPSCRVTVQGPARRLDLVLPATTALAELMPGVVALGVAAQGAGEVRPWRLTRPVGPDLEMARTLEESGVSDGDLLLLRHESAPALGVLRSDPVVALAGAVDQVPGRWTPERRSVLALSLLVPLLAGLLVATDLATRPVVTAAVAAAVVAVLLLAASASAHERRTAVAMCLLASLTGAAVGRAVADGLGAGGAGTLAWAAAGVGVAALLCLGMQAVRDVLLAVAVVALGAAAVAALGSTGLGLVRAAALGLVAIVGLLPFLPRLALRAAGLVRTGAGAGSGGYGLPAGRVDPRPLQPARAARTSVTTVLAALAPVVAVLAAITALGGGVSGRWLAAATGLGLLLRARAALFRGEVVALVLAGTAALAVGTAAYDLAALRSGPAAVAVLAPAVLCVGALLLALPAVRPAVASPGADRRLRQLESAALLALVPLALAVLGIFGVIADAASNLR